MSDADATLVVIPCLNEAAHLPALLAQLLADNPDRAIVVADGGSGDRSRAIVAEVSAIHPNVSLLDNPARIQSAGVNRAISDMGDGRRWFVRVDAHCRYPDGYVTGLIVAAERTGAISVVVPMVTQGIGCFQRAAAAAQNSVLGTGGSAHRHIGEGRFVEHGHHALMSIDAFRRAGGYNEAMSQNEDAELDQRLCVHGRIWLEPAQAIIYYPRSTARGLWRQYFGYGRGRAQTIALHGLRPRLRQMLPLAVPVAILLALAAPAFPPLALPLLVWIGLSVGVGALIGLRQQSVCAMACGVAAMIMHCAWGSGFLRQWLTGTIPKEAHGAVMRAPVQS